MKAKISSKGQIVIPKPVRDKLGLKPGDLVSLELLEGKGALIQPALKPPSEIFVKAGRGIVDEALKETKNADEAKIRKLLQSLGVKK